MLPLSCCRQKTTDELCLNINEHNESLAIDVFLIDIEDLSDVIKHYCSDSEAS